MRRGRTLLAGLVVALAALLVLPSPARAANVSTVVSALLQDPVYVDPAATAQIDKGRVEDAISRSGRSVYVAVLPVAAATANGGPTGITDRIGSQLGSNAILFTVAGSTLTGGAGQGTGLGTGEAARIASSSSGGDLTARLVDSVQKAASAASSGGGGSGDVSGSSGGSGVGVLAVVVLLVLLVVGLVLFSRTRRRRQTAIRSMEGSRADVESLYGRLGSDVSTLDPGQDGVARQALSDAAERYNAAGALMSKADTPGEWDAARRTVAEGLAATRLVRTRLGLDPGPEVPPAPSNGPTVSAPGPVRIGTQTYDASPTYAPGYGHYWGGGYVGGTMVPGGWYGAPFWEGMLLGGVLSGGFGGGYGGGYGYGSGYDAGFGAGYEQGEDRGRDDSSGGGDWGGGGGDWGGGGGFDSGGGGDWGGGGGGDSSGGSW